MHPLPLLAALLLTTLAASAKQPNILFLFSDDQRADTIAALGNGHIRTPNLDRLVQRGTAFTRAYCMGAMHGAVCVPSRAMLMTGRTLFRVDEKLEGQGTWPEQFAAAGYTTFISGKWHNGAASVARMFQGGKAIFLGGMTDPYKAVVQDITAAHVLGNKHTVEKHTVETFADCAVGFLREQKAAPRPWLCYVPFNAPHDPRVAPPAFHEPYNAAKPPLPANFLPEHPFDNGEMRVRDEKLAPWPRTPEVVRQHLADYYAAITFLDAQIGRVLDTLHETGAEENTIVVFSSDHGLAIGSHGLMGKQNLYEHSMRAPLLLAGPGIPAAKRSDALCYLLDIFPTLGALASVPAPDGSEGLSLAPVLAGTQPAVRDAIFTAYMKVQRAVRDDRWKLIVYPVAGRTQLFDLRDDPHELRDLSADPAHEPEVKRMRALLEEQQAKVGDKQR